MLYQVKVVLNLVALEDFCKIIFCSGHTPEDIPETDLFWLVGLLEGDGCFKHSQGYQNSLIFGSSDLDVCTKVASFLQTTVNSPRKSKNPKYKDMYYLCINGDKSARWMTILRPYMSARRQQAIDACLQNWYDAPGKTHNKGKGKIPTCHPNLKHHAKGLCSRCYRNQLKNK